MPTLVLARFRRDSCWAWLSLLLMKLLASPIAHNLSQTSLSRLPCTMSSPSSPVPVGHFKDSSGETDATVDTMATSIEELPPSDATRLTDKYPNAYRDFYGSGTPCIFKSGPDWPIPAGPQAEKFVREARPVYRHAIESTWLSIGKRIYQALDSINVEWTSINPLAYAHAGKSELFCPLILSIGVKPRSLLYDAAVAAATVVKEILAESGFPTIEVAFIESVVTRSIITGPKLLSFDPLDDVPNLRKPFTATLGLSIAPLKYPHFEGTAALYFRLGKDDERVAILTCAHVARPPPVYGNTGMTYRNGSQPREVFVALGSMAYNNAVEAMINTIDNLTDSITIWNDVLARLGKPVEGENSKVTKRRKEHLELVAKATERIEEVNAIHDEVAKHRTIPKQRILGFVLHSEKIEVSAEPYNFTKDWALIELFNEKIDWFTFRGNKIYVGMSFSISLSLSSSPLPLLIFFIFHHVPHLLSRL
jgi:hypothetical protein